MNRQLLFIIEKGGYPVFSDRYAEAGLEVSTVQSMRKALSILKKTSPDIICVEFNVDPTFRDRVSNLEPLLARLQTDHPQARVIVFAEEMHQERLATVQENFPIYATLLFPLEMNQLIETLQLAVSDIDRQTTGI